MNNEGAEITDDVPDLNDSDMRPKLPELMLGELTAAMAADSRTALDALPAPLAERAILVGEAMVRTSRLASDTAAQTPVNVATSLATGKPSPVPAESYRRAGASSRARTILLGSGWLAAAAMLGILAAAPRGVINLPGAIGTVALRDSLFASDSSLLQLSWQATADPSALGATGDVTWSARTQRGVMRIAGLAVNDPARWQYQLWIFDRNRDERYPVDGGVFNIESSEEEVLIAVNPNVPVSDATLFAVTVEPAGGVVVSSRERIVLTAGL